MNHTIRPIPPLELWGGLECTVNRVGATYHDQLERSGHNQRIGDLDRFAELGLRVLRYPIVWERTAPDGPERADWSWSDERLGRLRELGIRPIAGLVHHGSGPRHLNLCEPAFADGLAVYARAVAERYPWIDSYTPVNEPLTTARFCGRYGHWYPHGEDDLLWARALLTQCRAVVQAMEAIRLVNPAAQLVQTDDLGKIFSTPALRYQAEFENNRRWLTFDLLCGRVDHDHPMWGFLRWLGIPEADLHWFVEHACPPDVIGINHYLTSDRFLDDQLHHYPATVHGGNDKQPYADTEAVRVRAGGIAGPETVLREAWERYRLPVAVTEAHLGCTREEQLRWLHEVWQTATTLRQDGVDVRAVTVWSLLGAYDWNSLLTEENGTYEPGVFDLRGPQPRPTALAGLVRELATGHVPNHPVLAVPGWWRRPQRLIHGFALDDEGERQLLSSHRGAMEHPTPLGAAPVLITGGTGTLGQAFAQACAVRGLPYRLLNRQALDIADKTAVAKALRRYKPWAVINAAGYVRVDDAEQDVERCYRENTTGPACLAAACAEQGVALLTFSSDLVFDGTQGTAYKERDAVAPLGVYGHSKAEAETRVLAALPAALVVRTSAFFGSCDAHNFVVGVLRTLAERRLFPAADDLTISPTYVPDLVEASLDLLIDGEHGIWHLANDGALTWADLARQVATLAGLNPKSVIGQPAGVFDLKARRPAYSVLGSERGVLLPSLDDALSRFLKECTVPWHDGFASAAVGTRAKIGAVAGH